MVGAHRMPCAACALTVLKSFAREKDLSADQGTLRTSITFYFEICGVRAVGDYLDEVLLVLSVIGAPIILATLLYYGVTISERHNHNGADRTRGANAARKPPDERQSRDRDRSSERQRRPLELAKQRAGSDG